MTILDPLSQMFLAIWWDVSLTIIESIYLNSNTSCFLGLWWYRWSSHSCNGNTSGRCSTCTAYIRLYLDLVTSGLSAYLAQSFGLGFDVNPKSAGWFVRVFRVIVNSSIIFLKDDGVGPGVTLRMQLNDKCLTHMVSVVLNTTLFKMPRLLGQKWHFIASISSYFCCSAYSHIILHRSQYHLSIAWSLGSSISRP